MPRRCSLSPRLDYCGKLRELAKPMLKNDYGKYLISIIDEIERTGKNNLDF